ncbi:pleiotropic drug resistance protein ABC superfamily [Phytophthora cinnamomi]|uniref:pleiotropic drug resistance protein ABC superfamily n=1 Tax=Phytophthora cinnamomi TaxID=4785 RepID=UPI003559D7C3|nr:pleiotropic drug resistance protein ABC superfamily [Phytophthora cinnamomi]
MELATILGVLINAFGLMLTGFNPPALQIPAGYKWIYDICPHRYSFSVLVAIVFGDCSDAQLDEISLASAGAAWSSSLDLSSYPLGCRLLQNAPASVGDVPVKLDAIRSTALPRRSSRRQRSSPSSAFTPDPIRLAELKARRAYSPPVSPRGAETREIYASLSKGQAFFELLEARGLSRPCERKLRDEDPTNDGELM